MSKYIDIENKGGYLNESITNWNNARWYKNSN
jgi:hypothetical protein